MKRKIMGIVAALGLILALFGARPTNAAPGGSGWFDPHYGGKLYRAVQTPQNNVVVQTSFNGGATVAYGFDLGGYSLAPAADVTMFRVGNEVCVAINNVNTGYDYVKCWDVRKSDGDTAAAERWVPIRNFVADTTP
jgi:hypothetical protein